nr:hypothetical protein Iba_chr14aCG25550 [Ipomoea batatas]
MCSCCIFSEFLDDLVLFNDAPVCNFARMSGLWSFCSLCPLTSEPSLMEVKFQGKQILFILLQAIWIDEQIVIIPVNVNHDQCDKTGEAEPEVRCEL